MILMFRPPEINNEVTWTTTQKNKKRKTPIFFIYFKGKKWHSSKKSFTEIKYSLQQPSATHCDDDEEEEDENKLPHGGLLPSSGHPTAASCHLSTRRHRQPWLSCRQTATGHAGFEAWGQTICRFQTCLAPPGKADVPRNEVAHKKIKHMQVHEWLSICDGIDLNSCLSFLNSQSSKI